MADVNVLGDDSQPTGFVAFGQAVYFSADDGVHGRELWKTDGTAAGTVLAFDLVSGPAGSEPGKLWALNDVLLFSAAGQDGRRSLWRTDGAAGGTRRIADVDPLRPVELDGVLYFTATDDASGAELWRSDGTEGGTFRVADINPGPASAYLDMPVIAGGILYFSAVDDAGAELWRSDGSEAGTRRVADIRPGPHASNPTSLVAAGENVYFQAYTPEFGDELWTSDGGRSDGTVAGTRALRLLSRQGWGASAGDRVAGRLASTWAGQIESRHVSSVITRRCQHFRPQPKGRTSVL